MCCCNIVTCVLIFFGGIGFLVIREMLAKRCQLEEVFHAHEGGAVGKSGA